MSNLTGYVILGWDGKPHLELDGGYYHPTKAERIFNGKYFLNGDYPTDPITKEKLPIKDN